MTISGLTVNSAAELAMIVNSEAVLCRNFFSGLGLKWQLP